MEEPLSNSSMQAHEPRVQSEADPSEDMPACQSCRKRKLKCSRELPSCSQCSRLCTYCPAKCAQLVQHLFRPELTWPQACECIYDQKKQKPGLRSGVVESLNRRIETLERLLLSSQSQGANPTSVNAPPTNDAHGCLYHAALLVASEFRGGGVGASGLDALSRQSTDRGRRLDCKRSLPGDDDSNSSNSSFVKRRRHNADDDAPLPNWDRLDECVSSLPPPEAMDSIINAYFAKVHHWIPFVHQRRFRTRLRDQHEVSRLGILLHGMTVSAIRQVDAPNFPLDHDGIEHQIRVSRNVVMLNAMNSLAIENLQALALVAFDHMGSANFPRAWAIVGSLVRSVDYLQLTTEPDDRPRHSLMRPLTLLPKARSPGEIEDRRRVFWNVFLLDRFLSVTSGWNTSLNAQDVHRRLPANGKIWAYEQRATTPYFGILDKSTAKIGNLMSYASGPRSAATEDSHASQASPGSAKDVETMNVGALAFRIEATESLSQVTTFFLQQEVNFRNRDEVGKWLARFKELDLRLVHWKLFFPQRYGDTMVSKEQTPIEMDPNMTLAHLTHNTSMILLHQHIAYPPPELTKHVKIPSSCSAETCQLAAVEIASIIGKFLSGISYLVSAQFAFCAFVAARTLLVHWRFYDTELSPEFSNLISYLQEISRRWQGLQYSPAAQDSRLIDLDTAARYAVELQNLHHRCLGDPGFCTQILIQPFTAAYADADPLAIRHPDTGLFIGRDVDHHSPFSYEHPSPSVSANSEQRNAARRAEKITANHISTNGMATSPDNHTQEHIPPHQQIPQAVHHAGHIDNTQQIPMEGDATSDELTAMSHTLLGQQFSEMDRVFTLSGTNFTFDMSGWDAMNYQHQAG